MTQSKNNQIAWIADWLRFHHRLHGADAALFYDNNSTIYDGDELQRKLSEAVPEMDVVVIAWSYPYGPQAGPHWEVDGIVPDWDSDFCQVGVLQHARFRFLGKARSVIHNDIDELLIGNEGRSVFEAAEQSQTGMVKFEGRWISAHTDEPIDPEQCRHADFFYDEGEAAEMSPPKWCIQPNAFKREQSWGVHNIFGAQGNSQITDEFLFRHFRGITTNWHYDRWSEQEHGRASLVRDNALIAAYAAAGLFPSAPAKRASA